jgi:hypothetical protein
MQVMFKGSNGKIRQIGSFESDGLSDHEAHDKAYKIIKDFCDDHKFKIYYTRLWSVVDKDGVSKTIVDVGSHTEFFHIIPAIDINKLCSKDGE